MPDWPHSPLHRLDPSGTYMVTASTFQKAQVFNSRAKLALLTAKLFEVAENHSARLQAWAIFPNHYHFIASFARAPQFRSVLHELHANAARLVNDVDGTPRRRVWFQYWESHITYQRSYFARLHYVHRNAVHHGIVHEPADYPWCSAGWLLRRGSSALRKTIWSFPTVKLRIEDDFQPTFEFEL
jgi:putative transposase